MLAIKSAESIRPPNRLLGACLFTVVLAVAANADEFSRQAPFAAKLAAPMTRVVDGKSFRVGLQGIASQARLNLWIDRHVDPTEPIEVGPVGPTVMEALAKIAAHRDCVVFPVSKVVLIGRPLWVDRTAAAIVSLGIKPRKGQSFRWEDLTTPAEAWAEVAGPESVTEPKLPHDLWPETDWKDLDRRVALTLILAQLDLESAGPLSGPRIQVNRRPLSRSEHDSQRTRRYSGGDSISSIRSAVERVDPNCRLRNVGESVEVTCTMAAHRAAIAAMLRGRNPVAPPDPDDPAFQLTARATAGALFIDLAKTAGRNCKIDPDAVQACQQIVSIDAKANTSLRKLIDTVARQTGLNVTWQADAILISVPK